MQQFSQKSVEDYELQVNHIVIQDAEKEAVLVEEKDAELNLLKCQAGQGRTEEALKKSAELEDKESARADQGIVDPSDKGVNGSLCLSDFWDLGS